jgi:hypothetical protein
MEDQVLIERLRSNNDSDEIRAAVMAGRISAEQAIEIRRSRPAHRSASRIVRDLLLSVFDPNWRTY